MVMSKIVAVLGWKYEPEWMLDELKQNLSWVDDFAVVDCRNRDELWIHEGEYRKLQRRMARKLGADWILTTSADERWEKRAEEIIRPLTKRKRKVIYQFNLREMWDQFHYRVDNIWGEKVRRRLYPLLPGQKIDYRKIQCPSFPRNDDYKIEHVDLNIYHLKMMSLHNRQMRAKVFKATDPDRDFQRIGYDYLNDENGIELQAILKEREFFPKVTREYKFEVPAKYL